MSKHFTIVDGEKREIKSIYVGVKGEAVEIWNKEKGVLREDLYELYLRSTVKLSQVQEELIDQLIAEDNVKEEESLWQKLLKKLRK